VTPTAPQDHRRPAAETAAEPFTFTDAAGTVHTLPGQDAITAGLLRRYRKLPDLDMSFSILEEIADPDALTALDAMDIPTFNRTLTEWQEHLGAPLGK
jgi:hypothetical protein